MKKRIKNILFPAILIVAFFIEGSASTIGIATGNKTADSRPLLFKNKDRTDNYPSDVNYYSGSGGQYSYVFQMNDGQNHERARMGINSVGFGIVYSTSENLDGADTGPYASQLTATALKTCATIQDFRDLLSSTAGARKVHEHFGIIDSSGKGSLFEVDGYSHIEIQIIDSIGTMANTAKYHPSAGAPASGSTSPDREARAFYLLTHGPQQGLDYQYFTNEIIKDFCHTQQDEDAMPVGQYYTNPVLSRYKTAAGGVLRGILYGDNPLTDGSMWLCLSEPSLSIALPFFTNVDEIPEFIRSFSTGDGMAGSSDQVRGLIYDYSNGRYGDRYADTNMLINVRQHTDRIQDSLFRSYEHEAPEWRNQSSQDAACNMTNWVYDHHKWAKNSYDSMYTILDIEPQRNILLDTFQLLQNFPNPFNSGTIIPFRTSYKSNVGLRIFNTLGERIWSWRKTNLKPGFYEVRFNGRSSNSSIPAGIYFYTLKTDRHHVSRKMIYIP